MEYDPRNDGPRVPQHIAMFTEDAVDRLQAKAFMWGGAVGFVIGLICAALFFGL